MPDLKAVPQTGFDEEVIDDPDVESALEQREKHKASMAVVRKMYDGAHEAAVAEIAKLELPEGGAARVGRFRITRSAIPARSVSFEAKATSRIRIALVPDE